MLEIERIENLLNREGAVWVPIKHRLTTDEKEKIIKMEMDGLGFEAEESRYYPEGSASLNFRICG